MWTFKVLWRVYPRLHLTFLPLPGAGSPLNVYVSVWKQGPRLRDHIRKGPQVTLMTLSFAEAPVGSFPHRWRAVLFLLQIPLRLAPLDSLTQWGQRFGTRHFSALWQQ